MIEQREREAIKEIRAGMTGFGLSLDALSDQELWDGAMRLQAVVARCGVTAIEAQRAFQVVTKVGRKP